MVREERIRQERKERKLRLNGVLIFNQRDDSSDDSDDEDGDDDQDEEEREFRPNFGIEESA